MKLILSRKGFDSSAGGCASPIMPDGTLLPLPIPDRESPIRYEDVRIRGYSLGRVVAELTRGKQKPDFGAHLDPDLDPTAYPRASGWRPLFGQCGGTQTVLDREGVGPGDLFVFFGWFRRLEEHGGVFRFVRDAPDLHVLWGWLQVGTVLKLRRETAPLWAQYHPHATAGTYCANNPNNTLYVASEALRIGSDTLPLPGGGIFPFYDSRLQLTKPGANRSVWSLPAWFAPTAGRRPLGYHDEPVRWSTDGDRVELQTVARGQEFVLDVDENAEVLDWVRHLLTEGTLG